jgi:uncharacterized membrane protein YedE/YeeE
MRDYYLIRDTRLLKGLFGFLAGAFLGFLVLRPFSEALKTFPWFLNGKALFLSKWSSMGLQAQFNPLLPVPGDPISFSPKVVAHLLLAIIGGFGLGFLGVLAGGCPFRQHVMAAEGSISAMAYLLGFVSGALVFHKFIGPFVSSIFG